MDPTTLRVLHWYPDFFSGDSVAHSVRSLAQGQARAQATVAILGASDAKRIVHADATHVPGVQVLAWTPRWRPTFAGFRMRIPSRTLGQTIATFGAHILHAHAEFNPDNLWLPRFFAGPIVLSPRGGIHPATLTKDRARLRRLYVRQADTLLYRKLSAFHAISPTEAAHLERLLPGHRVYCTPQGCHLEVSSNSTPIQDKFSPVRVLFVGRLDVYQKGLDILLTAYAQTRQAVGSLLGPVVLVGPDWRGGKAQLQELAQRLGISEFVRFEPSVPLDQIHRAFTLGDLFAHPSRYEAFGKSAVEALVSGLPSILSNEVGAGSFAPIRSMKHVAIVPPQVGPLSQAIRDSVTNFPELQKQAYDARTAVKAFFDWSKAADQTLEIYRSLLQNNARRIEHGR